MMNIMRWNSYHCKGFSTIFQSSRRQKRKKRKKPWFPFTRWWEKSKLS